MSEFNNETDVLESWNHVKDLKNELSRVEEKFLFNLKEYLENLEDENWDIWEKFWYKKEVEIYFSIFEETIKNK
jgi:hypothetical protein